MSSGRKVQPPSPLRALGIQHLTFNISHLTFFVLAFLSCGCGSLFQTTPAKPRLYCVEGRVLDGVTRQGLGKTRVLLRATVPTQMNTRSLVAAGSPDAKGSGAVQLASYAVTDDDGAYTVELSEGFEVLQSATRIRLEASLPGYSAAGIDMPIPVRNQPTYKAPDLFLARGSPGPASTLPRGVTVPGAPSAPGMGPGFHFGPQPRRPPPNAIPWK